ncbi:MAG TPA: hypothetical protein VKB91_03590, partial [Gemmatimonadaceae bacterium]|nr:hypothetical protein [Gemmatimonadaceae bacterium]
MDLTNLVDVAIGLCLVYLGASLFVTIVNEYIGQVLRLRGRQLAGDLKQLINDEGIQKRLKASPALAPFFDTAGSSFKRQWKLQSYVDPNVLARLLVGGLSAGQQGMSDIVSALNALPPSSVKDQLLALARSVGNDVNGFVRYVSDWVDRSLTMLGEAYKRRIQVISFVIGIVIAIAFNLDTITLAG